jgi:putative FmdB family regulatory protein
MPLYEYQCLRCEKKSEVLQRLDEAPLAACPHCGGEVRKLISSPSFQFKGSGWYVTDYARKGEASRTEAKGDAAEGKSEGAGKSEGEGKNRSEGESKASAKPAASSSKTE